MEQAPDSEEDLRTAFTVFDKDKNGVITADELRSVLRSMDQNLSAQEVDSLIATLDKDGDGQVQGCRAPSSCGLALLFHVSLIMRLLSTCGERAIAHLGLLRLTTKNLWQQ